tara:strand:+ start:1748 stop:2950 length:1203 start_codon:yes stop_codon:yes gene_type:complete
MKVLHVLYTSHPNISGSSVRSRDVIQSQLKIGIMPIVITSPFQKPVTLGKKIEIINNVKYYRTYSFFEDELVSEKVSSVFLQIRKGLRLFKFTHTVYKIAQKEKVDLLHAHSMFFCAISAKVSSFILKKPFIYEVRSLWEERYKAINLRKKIRFTIFTIIETLSMYFSKDLIVISRNLKKHLSKRVLLTKKDIYVIPNAIDISKIVSISTIHKKPINEITFGYLGSLSKIEGLDLLINVFNKLEKNEYKNKLIIVGEGVEKDKLLKLSAGNNLIEFKNSVPMNKVKSIYDTIDIIIIPRKKSFLTDIVTPLKPLEAIMYKKVVMASNIGGIRELLEHNQTAILFKPNSESAIYNSIVKAINNNNLELLIKNSLKYASKHHSWDINAENYLRIYKDLINKQ